MHVLEEAGYPHEQARGHRQERRRPAPRGRPPHAGLHGRPRRPHPGLTLEQGQAGLPGLAPDERRIYSVAKVNRGLARRVDELPAIWVRGDLSELGRNERWATVFMTLEDPDEGATLRATMPRWLFDRMNAPVRGRRTCIVHGRPSLLRGARGALAARRPASSWPARARCSPSIEERKRRLAADGLFDDARKRPLPFWPRCIGLVGGSEAAAPRDVVENARRRFPAARFVLAETAVQGSGAAGGIVARAAPPRRRAGGRRDRDHARRRLARGPAAVLGRGRLPGDRGLPRARRLGRRPRAGHAALRPGRRTCARPRRRPPRA